MWNATEVGVMHCTEYILLIWNNNKERKFKWGGPCIGPSVLLWSKWPCSDVMIPVQHLPTSTWLQGMEQASIDPQSQSRHTQQDSEVAALRILLQFPFDLACSLFPRLEKAIFPHPPQGGLQWVDGSVTSCQVSVGRRILSWEWLSVCRIYMWEASSTKSVSIHTDVMYCAGALGKSCFTSPRACALLNKMGFSFVCLIRSLWMRVGTLGKL